MLTKVYRANDLGAALAQLRMELGPDAVILYQRQVPPARWWPFRRPQWEVIATDQPPLAETPPPAAAAPVQQLEAELAELRAGVSRLVAAADLVRMPKASRALTDCYDALNLKGMSADLAQEIVLCARDDLSSAARKQPELVRAAVRRHLEARIRVRSRQPVPGTGPLVVFLLGQTGVGKSTTLVKMAGLQARAGRSVGLINADTVRAAAGFQLEDMARPLGVEVESLPNVAAFKEALARHADQAALFVDTPGYGHADRTHLAELAAMIESAPRRQVFLVLACNTPLAELREITRGFRPLGLDGLIFSKADETQAVGIALTLACETDVPVAYISTGRRVPDDLEVATPAQLSRLLWDDSDTPEISDYHMPWKTERMHFETCYESPEKRLL